MSGGVRFRLAALAVLLPSAAMAAFDVQVDFENVSGERKTDWPVVLRAYHLFGRNLPPGTVDLKNLRVLDGQGKEASFGLEPLPPYDQPGNDEIILVIPTIGPGEKQSWRVSLAEKPTGRCVPADVVGGRHNLLTNGGFEKGGPSAEGWTGDGVRDTAVKHSGAASLLLKGTKRLTARREGNIPLHKGSWYYCGGWGKVENVSRNALYSSKGGYFETPGFWNLLIAEVRAGAKNEEGQRKTLEQFRQADLLHQCGTRDWAKTHFWIKGRTDWGMEEYRVQATADSTTFTAVLDQRKQFFMAPGQEEGKWWLDDLVLLEQPKVTVRFDLALAPAVKDGLFLFARPASSPTGYCLAPTNALWAEVSAYCSLPFPHEAATALSRVALRGQRVPLVLGLYHDKPLSKLQVRVADGALAGPEGARLAVEEVEWMPGSLGQGASRMLRTHAAAVDLPSARGVPYFVASFVIPADAKPGLYRGAFEVVLAGKTVRSVPVTLAVQDLTLPAVRDVYLGMILQGGAGLPYNDEVLRQYGRSGFTCLTPFLGWYLGYRDKPDAEGYFIDLEKVRAKMDGLVKHGITGGVCPFSDMDLGPLWGGGTLYKLVGGDKARWQAEIKRLDAECRKHPDWPRIIYMTWDEPNPSGPWAKGKHGGPDERMGWVNEAVPDALTNLDVHFYALDKVVKYYNMPTFDDPCDFIGPEVFGWLRKQGKDYGVAGTSGEPGESCRYQYGMMMASMGARYLHRWHLSLPENPLMEMAEGKALRSIELVAAGDGIDDFKAHRLLRERIAQVRADGDARKKALADEAEKYLAGVFKTWNADHDNIVTHPYLGYAYSWGDDGFYDRWREEMLRRATALAGVTWVEARPAAAVAR